MTRMEKKDGVDNDSLEWLVDEIPDQAAWDEYLDAVLLEGGGSNEGFGMMRAGSGFYDDEASRFGKCFGNNSGLYSFTGNELLTKSGGFATSGSFSCGNGSAPGGPGNVVRSEMVVGGGALYPNSVFEPGIGGLYDGRNMNGGLSDEDELCSYLNMMGVGNGGVEYASELKCKNVDFIGFRLWDDPHILNDKVVPVANGGGYRDMRNGFGGYRVAAAASHSDYSSSGGVGGGMMSPALSGLHKGHISDNLIQPQFYPRRSGTSFPPMGYSTLPAGRQNVRDQAPYTYHQEISLSNFSTTFNGFCTPDALYSAPNIWMNFNVRDGILDVPNFQPRPNLNISSEQKYGISPCRSRLPLNARMPQGGTQDINREGSFILQGEGMSPVSPRNVNCLRRRTKGSFNGAGGIMLKGKHSHQDRRSKLPGTYDHYLNQQMCSPFVIPHKIGSLAEVLGHLYYVAKDQTGCRFLQDIVEQRNPQAIQLIFDEIVKHVVELMINPFGNYFMQKLLDVCTEEQRTQIINVVTKVPGELVGVSMHDHGTRVIQKLIDTATTREQISKILAAIEPGVHALIKDSNGNHVIDRCLHCFTNEDNKFIFVGVIEYCIDIATNQFGCCVLQKCIGHSAGECRDRLVAEISNNAFLLSQDAFGNYVVQFIIDMKNPVYTSRLISEFRGNYVHLAMQKCSSHVVEKCLNVFNDHNKSQVIAELLSFNHFEQLLQDPHANYVVQTALRVSEGGIRRVLEEKIEVHRAASRNSPYSKRIFSSKKKKQ